MLRFLAPVTSILYRKLPFVELIRISPFSTASIAIIISELLLNANESKYPNSVPP
jgi:hypothetical protein